MDIRPLFSVPQREGKAHHGKMHSGHGTEGTPDIGRKAQETPTVSCTKMCMGFILKPDVHSNPENDIMYYSIPMLVTRLPQKP